MKRPIFMFFLFFCASLVAGAQTSETITELTPVPANVGKFSKKLPKNVSYSELTKIDFKIKTELINLPSGLNAVAVSIETVAEEVIFDMFDKPKARINVYGRITSKDKTTDGFFEEKLIVDQYTVADLEKSGKLPIILRKVFVLPAGKYQISVVLRDFSATNRGIETVKFEVPDSSSIIN